MTAELPIRASCLGQTFVDVLWCPVTSLMDVEPRTLRELRLARQLIQERLGGRTGTSSIRISIVQMCDKGPDGAEIPGTCRADPRAVEHAGGMALGEDTPEDSLVARADTGSDEHTDALPGPGERRPAAEAATTREFHRILAKGLVKAIQAAGGYGGGIYLRSHNGRSLVLAAVAGVPRSLVRSWWRLPVTGALPAPEAFRTTRIIYLCDAGDTMRRYPQMAAGLPYSFASAYAPIRGKAETFGTLVVLRPAAGGAGLTVAGRRRLRTAARRLGSALAEYAARGLPVEYDADPLAARLPAEIVARTRVGLFDWDTGTDALAADDATFAIFGEDPTAFDGTLAQLTARVASDDRHELEASARDAAETGQVRGRRFRVRDRDGRLRPVSMWARVPEIAGEEPRRHLVGVLVDLEAGFTAAEAAERLPDGMFSLDQDGRLTYANHSFEVMLHTNRQELLGRYPWEAVSWLSDPAYEDQYRAAMLSQRPTSFLAHDPDGEWFAFALYPDVQGLTGRVVPAEAVGAEPEAPAAGQAGRGGQGVAEKAAISLPGNAPLNVARPGALYHVVQMASVLTEAVTVREVCSAVADQLLPAFGGQELAIYVVRDRRMYLAWQTGYPEGFLDQFEGVPLDAPLPGVQALTSGTPLFFESERTLSAAYPGIPLDHKHSWAFLPLIASSHQVGSCILGFDTRRSFSTDERTALTALGGLVAQALERARLYDAEFTLARGLQQVLLPHQLPTIDGVQNAARYLTGTQGMEIGGDWYDVIKTGQDIALAIGDVEGHNVAAAAVMGQVRSALHAYATSGLPPSEVVRWTNQLLADLDPELFATCCYLQLDPTTGETRGVRAGHPPPVLLHPGGRAQVLELPGGPMLGVDRTARYPVTEFHLPPGSVLALYTDGLVEQPGQDIDRGIELLCRSLTHASASSLEDMADRIVQEAGHAPDRPDDVALLLTAFSAAS